MAAKRACRGAWATKYGAASDVMDLKNEDSDFFFKGYIDIEQLRASGDAVLLLGCTVLTAWDRRVNIDSRSAVLFREFWNSAAAIPNMWVVPFNPADPVNTPNGVAPAAMPAMLAALKSAAFKLQGLGIAFDARLGDYQTETRNGMCIPLHGGIGHIDGSYNSPTMRNALTATGYNGVHWSRSYIQTVKFDDHGRWPRLC